MPDHTKNSQAAAAREVGGQPVVDQRVHRALGPPSRGLRGRRRGWIDLRDLRAPTATTTATATATATASGGRGRGRGATLGDLRLGRGAGFLGR